MKRLCDSCGRITEHTEKQFSTTLNTPTIGEKSIDFSGRSAMPPQPVRTALIMGLREYQCIVCGHVTVDMGPEQGSGGGSTFDHLMRGEG
jgi:hypothetical protein